MKDTELKPGLEDVIVAETRLSAIDGEHGTNVDTGPGASDLIFLSI